LTVLGNVYDKYQTRNPVARALFREFLSKFKELLVRLEGDTLLEVGCGEGHLLQLLSQWRPELGCFGVDLSEKLFSEEVRRLPQVSLSVQTADHLAFPSSSFDLVVAAEMLEHSKDPSRALGEIRRVSKEHVILSVPREPLWRAMNMARLTYLRDLGNTPGHLQHWSSRQFVAFVSSYFEVVRVEKPVPWTIVLARKVGRVGK